MRKCSRQYTKMMLSTKKERLRMDDGMSCNMPHRIDGIFSRFKMWEQAAQFWRIVSTRFRHYFLNCAASTDWLIVKTCDNTLSQPILFSKGGTGRKDRLLQHSDWLRRWCHRIGNDWMDLNVVKERAPDSTCILLYTVRQKGTPLWSLVSRDSNFEYCYYLLLFLLC